MQKFVWTQTLEERQQVLDEFERKKVKAIKARYYQKNRDEIKKKQKEYYKIADRSIASKKYWEKNKETLKKKHKARYQENRESRLEYQRNYYMEHKEEILRKRKEKRRNDKSRESESIDRQSEKLVVGCIPAIQN